VRKISLLMLSLILSIVALSACGNKDDAGENNTELGGQEAEMPEPDLENIPSIVAEVNGEEITKEDFVGMYQQQFQQQMLQAQMSGQDVDEDSLKKQTADGMVDQRLLIQEANNRVSKVSEDEIDKVIDDLIEQFGLESKENMFNQFKEQGVDEEELMAEIEVQVKVEKLIAEEAGNIEPTDKEIEEAYEMIKSEQQEAEDDQDLPDFEEIKPQLKDHLKQQKEAEKVQDIVNKLREKADITVHI